LASLGFTTLGVIEATRAIRAQRTGAAHALRNYAGFVLWSYQQPFRSAAAHAAPSGLQGPTEPGC
jgi:hypothetical protein